MNLAALIPGILASLVTAGLTALTAYMVPGVRWPRRLAREIATFNGLPPGDERDAWRALALKHARELRYYEQYFPRRHKVWPWLMPLAAASLTVWAILDPRQLQGLLAEGPIMIVFGAQAVIGVIVFTQAGILGMTTHGETPETFKAKAEAKAAQRAESLEQASGT